MMNKILNITTVVSALVLLWVVATTVRTNRTLTAKNIELTEALTLSLTSINDNLEERNSRRSLMEHALMEHAPETTLRGWPGNCVIDKEPNKTCGLLEELRGILPDSVIDRPMIADIFLQDDEN